jgi:DNA-binding MarR family transcriptional regulator
MVKRYEMIYALVSRAGERGLNKHQIAEALGVTPGRAAIMANDVVKMGWFTAYRQDEDRGAPKYFVAVQFEGAEEPTSEDHVTWGTFGM